MICIIQSNGVSANMEGKSKRYITVLLTYEICLDNLYIPLVITFDMIMRWRWVDYCILPV